MRVGGEAVVDCIGVEEREAVEMRLAPRLAAARPRLIEDSAPESSSTTSAPLSRSSVFTAVTMKSARTPILRKVSPNNSTLVELPSKAVANRLAINEGTSVRNVGMCHEIEDPTFDATARWLRSAGNQCWLT